MACIDLKQIVADAARERFEDFDVQKIEYQEPFEHLLISGDKQAGKTDLAIRILDLIPDQDIAISEHASIIPCAPNRTFYPIDRDGDRRRIRDDMRRTFSGGHDIVFVSDIAWWNVHYVLEAMDGDNGPMVIACVHSYRADHVRMTFAERQIKHYNPQLANPDAFLVNIVAMPDGTRRIDYADAYGFIN